MRVWRSMRAYGWWVRRLPTMLGIFVLVNIVDVPPTTTWRGALLFVALVATMACVETVGAAEERMRIEAEADGATEEAP